MFFFAAVIGQQLAALGVEVLELGARVLLVGREVEVGAVGDALDLAELGVSEWEAVLDVAGLGAVPGVVRELVARLFAHAQVVAGQSDAFSSG